MPLENLQTIELPPDFCPYFFDDLMDSKNEWCRGLISSKAVLNFPRIFSILTQTIEKQSIINLSSCSSKGYACVVLTDSKVTFLLSMSLLCFVYIVLHNQRSISPNFLVFHTSGDIMSRSAAILQLYFFSSASSSSSINCISLMTSGLPSRFLMHSFYFWSFFFRINQPEKFDCW